MIKNILFDLDGTLLPMDQDEFTKVYIGILGKTFAAIGYDDKKLIKAIWTSFGYMLKNRTDKTNDIVFYEKLREIYGNETDTLRHLLDSFYANEFQKVQCVCGKNENAVKAVHYFKEWGLNIIIATLPAFPQEAIYSRIRWAGLSPEDFSYITAYENSKRCKPNPEYYTEIVNKLELIPEECLMVGNNVDEDMIAETIGMKCFLIPAHLINEGNKDINLYPGGDFNDLIKFVKENI